MLSLSASLGPLAASFSAQELSELVESLSAHGLRGIRPRPGIIDNQLPFAVEAVPWSPLGRFLVDRQVRPGGLLNFAVGDYAVQDAASLLPLTLMQLQPGSTVIDCCAAPGGKSAAVLEQLADTGLLVSNEVIASRIETLQLTLGRTGYANYMLTHQPVERLTGAMGAEFDCVLVDAPCTGQSLVSRDKQSMSAFSEHQIAHSAARQRTILQSAIDLVRPGGRLVYSTCTFAFDENEAIVAWLRERLPSWQPVVLPELAAWQTPGHAGCYRLWPHRDRCAGGFAAALMRPADDIPDVQPSTPRGRPAWQRIDFQRELDQWGTFISAGTSIPPSALNQLATMNRSGASSRKAAESKSESESESISESKSESESISVWQSGQTVCWFNPKIPDGWRQLAWSGIQLAQRFGAHWQPAWPMSVLHSQHFRPHASVELTGSQALTYYTGTSLHQPVTLDGPPWRVATWQGRSIAWTKLAANQLKNHLPKPLRHPNLLANSNLSTNPQA